MITAREYARSSKGKGGQSRSTDDQHAANLIAEKDFGPWSWGAPYVDTGSASVFATKARGDFARLMADLASGAFGARGDVLVLWEISRLSREMNVGTKIVDLAEAGGYLIHITSEDRTYDPSNYNDRYSLNAGINDAERESRRLSKRTLRGVESSYTAEGGARPHGKCPFGFAREYGLIDGRSKCVRQYLDPKEAPLIVELFERVLAGEALLAIARDWAARGITSRGGVPFSGATLRVSLTLDAYRGFRVHHGRTVKGNWPAIIDDETWFGVQALLADPSRRSYTGQGIQHAYTMIVRCDECSGPISVTFRRAVKSPLPPGYQCHHKGCLRINKEGVDAEITGAIVAYLERLRSQGLLDLDTGDGSPELVAVRTELAVRRGELRELEAETPATLAEGRVLARMTTAKESLIRDLEKRLSGLSRPDRLAEVFAEAEDIGARWDALPVTAQRELAGILLTPGLLGEVRITRAPAMGVVVPAADRLRWVQEG